MTGLTEVQSGVCPMVGSVAKVDVGCMRYLLSQQIKKAMISKLPYYMREITVGNFSWTDGSAVWGMSSRITHTTLINEVLTTVAVNVIWQPRFQLPTNYVYDVISSQPPIATTCSNLQNFGKYLAYYIRIL